MFRLKRKWCNHQIQCRSCFGRGTVGTFRNACLECGAVCSHAYCGKCNGSGKIVSVCTGCDFYNHMVSCKNVFEQDMHRKRESLNIMNR